MRFPPSRGRLHRGVSLIELLVGIAVGMIGVLVIFQTATIWDKHTRTTTAGGDAQVAGTLAMFNLERDVKLGGYGFAQAPAGVMDCPVFVQNVAMTDFRLRPVTITADPSTGSDIITVLHGNSSLFVTTGSFSAGSTTTKQISRRGGFRAGDRVVFAAPAGTAGPAPKCALVEVTSTANPDGVTVAHDATAALNTPATDFPHASGFAFNLGPGPELNQWKRDGSKLTRKNVLLGAAAPAVEVADDVVDVRAQYGVDLNNDRQITAAALPAEWTSGPLADTTRVLAVRVAILVRSRQFEKAGDTTYTAPLAVPPSWFGTNFVMRNVDGTGDSFAAAPTTPDPNNWRFYRYRVYERVIPLRNMMWVPV